MVSDLWQMSVKKKWTSMGYILVATHFVAQLTNVSRHPRVWKESTISCLGETVWKIWSQKSTRRTTFVPRRRQRLLNILWCLVFSFVQFFALLWTNKQLFWNKSDNTNFKFSLHNFFFFSFLNSRLSKTCVNCVTKCVTVQIYPHGSPFPTNVRPYYENSYF